MIVDTSALLAILLGEPDADRYDETIAEAYPPAQPQQLPQTDSKDS